MMNHRPDIENGDVSNIQIDGRTYGKMVEPDDQPNQEFCDEFYFGEEAETNTNYTPIDESPTKAFIRINMFQIGEIDTVTCSFAAHFHLTATWRDPKLKIEELKKHDRKEQSVIIQKSFDPKIMFMNTIDAAVIEESTCPAFQLERGMRGRDGSRVFSFRMGVTARFREQFELKNFPLDAQPLNIIISSNNHEDVITLHGNYHESLVRKEFMVLNEFNKMSEIHFCRARTLRPPGSGYSLLYTGVVVSRNYVYYEWNVFLPIFLITLMSVTTFLVPLEDVADRCGVILTLLLTSVAFKFVVGQDLPKISYNTYLDTYVLVSFIVLTFIALGVAFVGFTDRHVSRQAAINIDRAVLYTSVGAFIIWHIVAIKIVHGRFKRRKGQQMGPSQHSIEQSNGRLELIQSII